MAEQQEHKAAASSSSAAAGFVYAGGEFADDAPYVEELHGLGVAGSTATFGQDGDSSSSVGAAPDGGFGDLDNLLSSIIDGADDDGFEDPDTCFSINAAASFAALVSPEEQIAELHLQAIEAEQAQAAVDVLTPVEIMQMTLLLQQFRVPDYDGAADLPSSLRALPLFFASGAGGPLRSRWFAAAEKQLMQGLSVLSIGLNRENVATASAAAPSPAAAAPVVYSLLFRGSKVTSAAKLSAILSDLHSLLALADVVQPALLIKQLLAECARSVTEILQDARAMSNPNKSAAAASVAPASASAAPSDSADPVASLVIRLSSLQVSPQSSLPLTAPFTLDLGSGVLSCPDFAALDSKAPEQLAALREILGVKQEEDSAATDASSSSSSASSIPAAASPARFGALLPRLLSYLFVESSRAVWVELVSQVRALLSLDVDAAALAASLEPSVLLLLLLNQSAADSALASLLSADNAMAAAPDQFFARWIPAAIEAEVTDLAALDSSSAAATARYLSLRTTAKQLAELTAEGLPSVPKMQRAILVELLEQ